MGIGVMDCGPVQRNPGARDWIRASVRITVTCEINYGEMANGLRTHSTREYAISPHL